MDHSRILIVVAALAFGAVCAPGCNGESQAGGDGDHGVDGDGDGDDDPGSGGTGDPNGTGGDTGPGGDTASTGTGGMGGGGTEGQLPILGDSCDDPGVPSCSSNNDKLVLLCSADGEWEATLTCGSSELCDPRASSDSFGECIEVEPLCEGLDDGTSRCDGDEMVVCLDGGLGSERTTCPLGCEGEECVPGDACPPPTALECSGDCEAISSECEGQIDCSRVILGSSPVDTEVRVGAGTTCSGNSGPGCDETYIPITTTNGNTTLRVTVGEGWQLVAIEGTGSYWLSLCDEEHVTGCVISPATDELVHGVVVIPDADAPPRNVQVEVVPPGTECL